MLQHSTADRRPDRPITKVRNMGGAHAAHLRLPAPQTGFPQIRPPRRRNSRVYLRLVTMENIANLDAQKMAILATFDPLPPEPPRSLRGRRKCHAPPATHDPRAVCPAADIRYTIRQRRVS